MQSIGNDRANLYWEGKKGATGFAKPSGSATPQQRKSFIKEKYIKKVCEDADIGNPVELYHKAVEKGVNAAEYIRKNAGNSTTAPRQGDSKLPFKKPELSKVSTQAVQANVDSSKGYSHNYKTQSKFRFA